MTRLMECLEAKEGVEAQFAGVYILKWRSEWGPPEYLFREVDDDTQSDIIDKLLTACKAALVDLEPHEWTDIDDGYAVKATVDKLRAAIKEVEGKEDAIKD